MNSFFETLKSATELVTLARSRGDVNQVRKALGLYSAALEAYTWSLDHAEEAAAAWQGPLTEDATRVLAEYPSVAAEYYMAQGDLL